ncbi:MAG: ATP-binding protein [Parcubacteria group bacterium]|jgi:hypothetical protein
MTNTNRTSSIRSGFAYQNFWGLRLCGEWLASPEQYKWIQFETCPDEKDPNKFYLDDIVCLDSDNLWHLYQTKYRQDCTNKWTWDNFLNAERSGGTSLIRKWANSLANRLDKTKAAFFITNGDSEDCISKYIYDELLNIEEIKKKDPALYDRIVVEIGIENDVDCIFQTLRFQFNQENLSSDELEKNIRKYYYEKLNATESGVTNLYHEIDKECRQKNTQQLSIELLRKWCEFDTPRSLDEQFDIPTDFEFFDDKTHQSILNDLGKTEGGIRVIFGNPGVGKSVYLSKLSDELGEKKIISIKHHYHISPEDSNPQERLNAKRVIEAIKSQLKSHKEALGDLANKDSRKIPVGEFITKIGTKLNGNNKTLVIIIDGLDHVLRYGEKEELESFLREICVPQPGVWIVIGMQLIAKSHLPQVVFDKFPENKWMEIKGLSKEAVSRVIQKNNIKLHLPDQAELLKSLVEKLFSITDGNPLHLRYSLQQLKNISGNSIVTEYSCNDLISYGDGIEKYYDSLWNHISDNAKSLLLTMASVNFLFTEQQLIECISFFVTDSKDVTDGFNQISHLISKNIRGQMSVFHNSFELFLRNRKEMTQQKIVIKTNIKKWLEQSNYEYLKWAELRIIEHELGNSERILEIDREWLIDAICYPCNTAQISKQMKLAVRVNLEKEDFGAALQISYLHTYYINSKDFAEETPELIFEEALCLKQNIFEYIDFKSLPTTLFSVVAEMADSNGNNLAAEEAKDELIERLSRQEYRKNEIPRVTGVFLDVIPFDRAHKLVKVYKYIVQFRNLDVTGELFKIYSRRLLELGQKNKVLELLKLKLNDIEKRAVLAECAVHGFKNRTEDCSIYFNEEQNLTPLCLLYKSIRNEKFNLPALPKYDIFPETIREHDPEERKKWSEFYYHNFIVGLLYGFSDNKKDIEKWIANIPDAWPAKAVAALFVASLKVSDGIKNCKFEYVDLFNSLVDLQALKWPEDRDVLNFQTAFSDAISEIFEIVIYIKGYIGDNQEITLSDYIMITGSTSFLNENNLTALVLKIYRPLFSREVYEKIKNKNIYGLRDTVDQFPIRAREYGVISKLARLYEDLKLSKEVLKKAADNLLGYGDHKDVYLFDVLEVIEFCAQAGVGQEKINEWILKTIPLIENVGKYTDGDETHALPIELADVLAKYNPGLLRKYYYWSADQENLYHAEDLFECVLTSLVFKSEEEIALAKTVVEKDSFLKLKATAVNNLGASEALNDTQAYLGEISFPEEKQSPYTGSGKPVYNYSEINPDKLVDHISNNFENKWERNSYLEGWFIYWLEKNNKAKIYDIFKNVIDKFGVQSVSGEILDIAYPLAYEFDNEAAFDIVCKAQSKDNGWQGYWTDKKKSEKRWQFIKEKYPQRYVDFFQKSTNGYIPLSRGVEYFLLFNDLKRAEEIVEASIQFAKSLMANSNLPSPAWLEEKEIDALDILIQRLIWPSPLVRERAATALASLLCSSKKKLNIFNHLLLWLKQQKIESVAAIGLLPIIKTFYICKDTKDLKYINIDDVASSMSVSSEVIEALFKELSDLKNKPTPNLKPFKNIKEFGDGYIPSSFFSKHVQTFLAPIYMDRAKNIERRSGKSFIKQWAFISDEIIKDLGIEPNHDHVYYYGRSQQGEFLLGFSTKISEVYRSAFLRAIQYFYQNGDIEKDFYLEYAYATLPIELSKWKILPNRAPEWWPQIASKSREDDNEDTSLESISFKKAPEDLINNQDDKLIIAAEGAIKPDNGWKNDPEHSFKLIAFGYRAVGPEVPTPDEVSDRISYASPGLITIPSRTHKPFNFLEDKENHLPVRHEPFRIKDIVIYPIIARERDLSIALWQYFRDYNVPFNLNLPLSQELKLVLQKNSWQLEDKNGKAVVMHSDWLEGLKERYNRDMPIPHGQFLIVEQSFLDDCLGKDIKIGYMLKTTYRTRKHSYDEVEKDSKIKLINVIGIPEKPKGYDLNEIEERNAALNKYLENITDEELLEKSEKETAQTELDFQALKEALKNNKCSLCGNSISQFSEKKPCLHWLLKPNGFKKKHFPLLFEKYNFHRMEAYLRWVANTDVPLKNINDLVEEKTSSKKIELTIRYKNLEWSFSCAESDFSGHQDSHEGKMPHYHFQMKLDDRVIINYGGFHIPFHDEDFFGFSISEGKIPRLGYKHIHGAGMQELLDNFSPDELLDQMIRAENYDDAQLHTSTLVEAAPGTTISGTDIANLYKEHKETGIPMAKLIKKLPNVKAMSVISPGPGVPDLAKRTSRRRKGDK